MHGRKRHLHGRVERVGDTGVGSVGICFQRNASYLYIKSMRQKRVSDKLTWHSVPLDLIKQLSNEHRPENFFSIESSSCKSIERMRIL